jgi:hypothetical protein
MAGVRLIDSLYVFMLVTIVTSTIKKIRKTYLYFGPKQASCKLQQLQAVDISGVV